MKDEQQGREPGPWILFPEIIGVSVLALLLPVLLVHLLLAGQALVGIVGFVAWLAALFFAVRFVRRRQYGLAILPMLAILVLYFIVRSFSH